MFDSDFFARSLKIRLLSLTVLPDHCFSPRTKLWPGLIGQVYGVEDMRARLGPFETPWAAASRFPVPDLDSRTAGRLHDIFDARACEILSRARAKDKKIVVMWSGGIDSTAILCSFIRNIGANDLGRLVVCTTTTAVSENPFFYISQISGKLEILHWYDLEIDDQFFRTHILLHGDPGDCIFGPSVTKFQSLWPDRQYLQNWKVNRSILYELYHSDKRPDFAKWWVDKVCDNLEAVQSEGKMDRIKTISDWHWWNYFNLKWQGSMTRVLERNKRRSKDAIDTELLDEFFDLTFYASPEFQSWSYQNLHNLIGDSIDLHKREVKHYIYSVDGNGHYRNTASKVKSIVPSVQSVVAIGQDGVHYDLIDGEFADAFLALLRAG